MLEYYKDADDLQIVDERNSRNEDRGVRSKGNSRRSSSSEEGYTRFFLNFGKSDGLYPNQLIELINKCVPGRVRVGKIDLRDSFSFFEIEDNEAKRVMNAMNGFEVDGRRISVEFAQEKKDRGSFGGRDRGGFKGNKRDSFRKNDRFDSRDKNSDKPWRKRTTDKKGR